MLNFYAKGIVFSSALTDAAYRERERSGIEQQQQQLRHTEIQEQEARAPRKLNVLK
jgi:hypothetical protein